jgi:type II secretory pathway component PulF
MAQGYSYRARSLSGGMVTGRVQAENPSAVIALLRARNLFVVQVKPSGVSDSTSISTSAMCLKKPLK